MFSNQFVLSKESNFGKITSLGKLVYFKKHLKSNKCQSTDKNAVPLRELRGGKCNYLNTTGNTHIRTF